MNEENIQTNNIINYQTYYVGNDLDIEGYYYADDMHIDKDFVSNNNNYKDMSTNVPKISE